MKIILSNMCVSLVGMLKTELGYFIVKRKGSFFSQRSRWGAPSDGHWRFIVLCAEIAKNHLYISDIEVSARELREALMEARRFIAAQQLKRSVYHADDIINLKHTFGL